MRKIFLLAMFLLSICFIYAQDCNCDESNVVESELKFSDLSDFEKAEAIEAMLAGDCYYKGIKLWGRVKFVDTYPDIEIQYVETYPDIALIFSNNPDNQKPFDVVIVELKKRGISLEENMKVITQLEKRARRLMRHYNNQIQRIWFYGIIEFSEEVEMQLAGEYTELYSSGKMYYRETNVAISLNPKITLPIGVFIWDLDAVIKDADARNSAFLNLIKSKFIE
jgi:hypothetical protein